MTIEAERATPVLVAAPVERPRGIDYQRLLALKGHGELTPLLTWDGLWELYKEAKYFGKQNALSSYRCDRRELFHGTMLRFVPDKFFPPINLRNKAGEITRGPAGRAISAIHFYLSEQGVRHIICITRGTARSVAHRGKPFAKNLVDQLGGLSMGRGHILDLDGTIGFDPETPQELTNFNNLAAAVQPRLHRPTDLTLACVASCWRGKTVQRLEYGYGTPDSLTWKDRGHLYYPKHEAAYDPFGNLFLQMMESSDLNRYIFPIWLPKGKIVGVEADFLWQHRQLPAIHFTQNGRERTLRPTISHWAGRNLNQFGEILFDIMHHLEECTCGNAIPAFDFEVNGAVDSRTLTEDVFINTGSWMQKQVFHRFVENANALAPAPEVKTKIALSLLRSINRTIDADPLLGTNLLCSPEDCFIPGSMIHGTGLMQEIYPDAYTAYKNNKEGFETEAASCDWGLGRVGFKWFAQKLEESLGGRQSLAFVLTPLPFRNEKTVVEAVRAKLDQILG
ncbi:MAG: hypothetical protein ACOX50_00380 [Patescibacteria group bacterium]|jgi:hypothetical protein